MQISQGGLTVDYADNDTVDAVSHVLVTNNLALKFTILITVSEFHCQHTHPFASYWRPEYF